MSDPIEPAWLAALQVVRYINFTADHRLILGPYRNMEQRVVTHTDANWASDRNTQRRSTSGSMTFIYGCPVSWKSDVQKCVALSAVEAELVAASEAARENMLFAHLLRDLGCGEVKPLLLTDSLGCCQVSKHPAKHWKLKHIDTRYLFVRNAVQDGDVAIKHIGTADYAADILTKSFQPKRLRKAVNRLGLVRPSRGRVEDTMVDQDPFGMVSAGSTENYVPSRGISSGSKINSAGSKINYVPPHGVLSGSKINYVPSPVVSVRSNEGRDEIALACSARVYHRNAHRPRPAQSEDESESGDRCPESQDEQFTKT